MRSYTLGDRISSFGSDNKHNKPSCAEMHTICGCSMHVCCWIRYRCRHFSLKQRGKEMSIFCSGIQIGPLLGPVIGGALTTTSLTWRAAFWFCTAYAGTTTLLVAFILPETFRDSKLFDHVDTSTSDDNVAHHENRIDISQQCNKKATSIAASRATNIKPSLWKIVARPLSILRYPHVLPASSIFAIALSCLLVVETLLPVLFSTHYNLPSWAIGK